MYIINDCLTTRNIVKIYSFFKICFLKENVVIFNWKNKLFFLLIIVYFETFKKKF